MTKEEGILRIYLGRLLTETGLTRLGLSKKLGMPASLVNDISNGRIALEDLSLGNYQKLIQAKDYSETHGYEIFLSPEQQGDPLAKQFGQFFSKVIEVSEQNIQAISLQIAYEEKEINRILDYNVHPDKVTIATVIKLLTLIDETEADIARNRFREAIASAKFFSPVIARWRQVFKSIANKHDFKTDGELAKAIGIANSTFVGWQKGEVPPENISTKYYRKVAQLMDWSMDQLHDHINGIIGYDPAKTYAHILSQALELSFTSKIELQNELAAAIRKEYISKAVYRFSEFLRDAISSKNWGIQQAAQKLGILPPSRLQAILDRKVLPGKEDLPKIVASEEVRKEDGELITGEDLKALLDL